MPQLGQHHHIDLGKHSLLGIMIVVPEDHATDHRIEQYGKVKQIFLGKKQKSSIHQHNDKNAPQHHGISAPIYPGTAQDLDHKTQQYIEDQQITQHQMTAEQNMRKIPPVRYGVCYVIVTDRQLMKRIQNQDHTVNDNDPRHYTKENPPVFGLSSAGETHRIHGSK